MRSACRRFLIVVLLASPGAAQAAPRPAAVARPAGETPVKFDPRWLQPYFASGVLAQAAERFRRGDNAKAVELYTRGSRSLPARDPQRLAAQYMTAMAHMEREDWTAAGALFEE